MGRECLRVLEMGPLTAQALAGPHPSHLTGAHLDWSCKPLRLLLGILPPCGTGCGSPPLEILSRNVWAQ